MLLTAASGCSRSAPEILEVFHRVNFYMDRELELTYPKLSLFIIAEDPDGYDDLDVLYLVHDGSERFWTLDRDEWQKRNMDG